MKVVAIFSGGLDSTCVLYKMVKEGYEVYPIFFTYGQNHITELNYAKKTCEELGLTLKVVDLPFLKTVIDSKLIDGDLPEWEEGEEYKKQLCVHNRNMIFISIAVGYAQTIGAEKVGIGVCGLTPQMDGRPDFINHLNEAVKISDWNYVELYTPYVGLSKGDVIRDGLENGVKFENTWSCYEGEDKPCGNCGACIDRAKGFEEAGVLDPLLN